jgi:hypothetical protein
MTAGIPLLICEQLAGGLSEHTILDLPDTGFDIIKRQIGRSLLKTGEIHGDGSGSKNVVELSGRRVELNCVVTCLGSAAPKIVANAKTSATWNCMIT